MSLTSIVSRQNRKIRILVQEQAILEKRVRELEESMILYYGLDKKEDM